MGVALRRRQFLQLSSAAGALILFVPSVALAKANGGQIGHYVRIAPDNSLIIRTATTEIGQGTNTSVPMLIVEELDYPFERATIENFTPPFSRNAEGRMSIDAFADGAGGSTAIWDSYDGARQAGAKVRRLLMDEAAARWGVAVDAVATEAGHVVRTGTRQRFTYGELAGGAAARPLPADQPLKPRTEHKLIGTPQKQKAARAIVTGAPLFGIDQRLDGMLYAVMLRSPFLDGELKSLDDSKARAMPGVRAIVQLPRPALGSPFRNQNLAAGVAVVADSFWRAKTARDALVAEWIPGPSRENSPETYAAARAALNRGEATVLRGKGDVAAAFATAAKVVEATYELPMVAHAHLEPQTVIAHVAGDRARIITSTQQPVACAVAAAAALGIPESNVDLTPARCGGGFGRRLFTDMVVEAALIAKSVPVPVKLMWTRECEMAADFYRPGGVHRLRAALGADGRPTGWHHQAATQSMMYRQRADMKPADYARLEVFPDDMPGGQTPNQRVDYLLMDSAAPRGFWRAPGHNNTAFVQQCFVDECAEAAGQDPLDYRLMLLGQPREVPWEGHGGPVLDTGRMAAVLRLAADKAGWRAPLARPRGRGLAVHFSFGTYVAHVVDVTMRDGGAFSVDRVVSAIDCGIAVNPNGIAMQNEGAINDALSTALGQAITIRDGHVEQANFDTYEMMRIDRAACTIETHIVASDKPPRGMGEPALPPFAPALVNALYAATGKRVRTLPIGNQLA
jgi:isoquinoline 1-oxidoreductase beta subunit